MGWILAHPSLGQVIENLIQYSTSGVAQFMQRAGVAALEQGENFVARQIARAREGRDIVTEALASTGRCRFALPQGAFYLLFAVEGESDMRALARRLVDEAGVGLAPGTAFGAGGENFLRLCFARDAGQLRGAAEGIVRVLARLDGSGSRHCEEAKPNEAIQSRCAGKTGLLRLRLAMTAAAFKTRLRENLSNNAFHPRLPGVIVLSSITDGAGEVSRCSRARDRGAISTSSTMNPPWSRRLPWCCGGKVFG